MTKSAIGPNPSKSSFDQNKELLSELLNQESNSIIYQRSEQQQPLYQQEKGEFYQSKAIGRVNSLPIGKKLSNEITPPLDVSNRLPSFTGRVGVGNRRETNTSTEFHSKLQPIPNWEKYPGDSFKNRDFKSSSLNSSITNKVFRPIVASQTLNRTIINNKVFVPILNPSDNFIGLPRSQTNSKHSRKSSIRDESDIPLISKKRKGLLSLSALKEAVGVTEIKRTLPSIHSYLKPYH
jgi:hypothetical protein